jgi:hypothetical protein
LIKLSAVACFSLEDMLLGRRRAAAMFNVSLQAHAVLGSTAAHTVKGSPYICVLKSCEPSV